jgi:hypothetical protein
MTKRAIDKTGKTSSEYRRPAGAPGTRTVHGQITDQNGSPQSGLAVKAFDRNIGKVDTLFGQAATDAQGNYRITYASKQLDGKSTADLVVAVYQGESLLQTSDVIFDASPEVVKDFTIAMDQGPEFQRLAAKIEPLLRNKAGIAELGTTQTRVLSQQTGTAKSRQRTK